MKALICVQFLFALLLMTVTGDRANAQTVQAALDRNCSFVTISDDRRARFAASVGIMSADPATRQRLFAGYPEATGSETCARVVSQSFCSREYFDFTVAALTGSMPVNPGGRAFFSALDALGTTTDPAGSPAASALGMVGATAGGIVGFIGGDNPLAGAAKGALVGGALGLGSGVMIDTGAAYAKCGSLQADFTDLTDRLRSAGLRGYSSEAQLRRDIQNIAVTFAPDDARLAEAMLAAMAVTADRIEAGR